MAVLKADKAYRRRYFLMVFILLLPIPAMVYWGLPVVAEYVCGRPAGQLFTEVQIVLQMPFLLYLPVAVVSFNQGRRILASGLFPPPGQKVIRDTVILEGKAARRRGYLVIFFGVFVLLVTLSAAFIVIPHLFDKFRRESDINWDSNLALQSNLGADCADTLRHRMFNIRGSQE